PPPARLCRFLLPSHVLPPSLRPFPTRRSSDLSSAGDPARLGRLRQPAALVGCLLDVGSPDHLVDPLVALDARVGQGIDQSPQRGDRKSTRLNSSHEWISYAVFCLKKNTTRTVQ